MKLASRVGFEIELLAPPGKNRHDLALAIAAQIGGRTRRCFYPQSEPSLVPGTPIFENITLGFDVLSAEGVQIAKCVDDLTIKADLDRDKPSFEDWYRIVSDDIRFLRLIMAQCDPDAPQSSVLEPIAALFGTELKYDGSGLCRAADGVGAPIALAAGLPGERERPCELITQPIDANHLRRLEMMLSAADHLGFTVPAEAAVHFHFDAGPYRSAQIVTLLVNLFSVRRQELKQLVGTNEKCVRLGDFDQTVLDLVNDPGFADLDWPEAVGKLRASKLSKYCDLNIFNLVHDIVGKQTLEIRIMPGSIDAEEIIRTAVLFEAILGWVRESNSGFTTPPAIGALMGMLSIPENVRAHFWK